MSQVSTTGIARSSVQRLFAVLEDTPGQPSYPAREDFIAVANDATATQTPQYTDSQEKLGTRDVIERFRGATPAGESSPAMLLRVGKTGEKPQGYAMLLSLFGTSTLEDQPEFQAGPASGDAQEIPVRMAPASSYLPPLGIIEVNGEQIAYDAVQEGPDGLVLTGCKRGQNGTAAAAIAAGSAAEYKSIAFLQANSNPTFTLWLQTDHFLQGMTGCTVNQATISVSNDGPVKFEFSSVQGMEMILAGTGTVNATAAAGSSTVMVDDPRLFTAKARVWNSTVKDANADPATPELEEGYLVLAVDEAAKTLTLDKPLRAEWPAGSIVSGFLPQGVNPLGAPLEGVDTEVFIDGVQGTLIDSSVSYSNNINYLTNEVGTRFPKSYVEGARSIETELNTYFRAADAARFTESYEGRFVSLRYAYGRGKAVIHMPRVQQTMPAVNIQSPVVSLDISGTALGTGSGNNAVYFIVN